MKDVCKVHEHAKQIFFNLRRTIIEKMVIALGNRMGPNQIKVSFTFSKLH